MRFHGLGRAGNIIVAGLLVLVVLLIVLWRQDREPPRSESLLASVACPGAPTPASAPAPAAACSEPAQCPLQVLENPLIQSGPDGNAVTVVRLCNRGTQSLPLALNLSDFSSTDRLGQAYALNTRRSLAAVPSAAGASGPGLPAELAAGACANTRIEVNNLLQSGPMTATLSNGDQPLTHLTATRVGGSFDVGADGGNPDKLEIALTRRQDSRIGLINKDSVWHRVNWRLELGNAARCGVIDLRAKGSGSLELPAAAFRYRWLETGFISSGTREGRLILQRDNGLAFWHLATDVKTLPVTAKMSYFVEPWQGAWNTIFAFILLLTGVLVSLVVSYALPMQGKRVALKERLADLERTLNGQADLIGARTLNILRVELSRLRAAIDARLPFLPEAESAMPRLDLRVSALEQRVEITRRASLCLGELKVNPNLTLHEQHDVSANCTLALKIAEKNSALDSDLKKANDAISASQSLIDASDAEPTPEAVRSLIGRFAALQARLSMPPYVNRFIAPVPGSPTDAAPSVNQPQAEPEIWTAFSRFICKSPAPFMDTPLTPDAVLPVVSRNAYIDAAKAVWQTELTLNYAQLVLFAPTRESHERRIRQGQALLQALAPGPTGSAIRARRLLQEIEEDVYEEDVTAALRAAPDGDDAAQPGVHRTAWIEIDPPQPLELQPVVLRVRLWPAGVDAAEARKDFSCEWKVDGEDQDGDEFCTWHYFKKRTLTSRGAASSSSGSKASYEVRVDVVSTSGERYSLKPVAVSVAAPLSLRKSSLWLAGTGLAITVIVVTAGLMTAAQDKLQTLQWTTGVMTLLGLGFGADVLKRALIKQQ